MGYQCEDFAADLEKCTVPDGYVWVNSGYGTCAPLKDTVAGAAGCFAPPFAAGDTKLTFSVKADGHLLEDTGNRGKGDCGLLYAGAVWQPDKIIRKGTYHYQTEEKLLSLQVKSELVPLYGQAGFLVKVQLKNRLEVPVFMEASFTLSPGHPGIVELKDWDFMPPQGKGEEAVPAGENCWENSGVRITLLQQGGEGKSIAAGECFVCYRAVVFTASGESVSGEQDLKLWQARTRSVWERRLERAGAGIPVLKSDIPGLEEYYKRSLISGLVCLWENDTYVTNPFPSTSGMDGGSVCCYPWDVAGYSARMLTMLFGDEALRFLGVMLDSGIDSHICMALSGQGLGWCNYSYSMWSLVSFYWVIVTMTGKGQELFDKVSELFLQEERRLPEWEHLKDYGRQHNLLEMRSCGYEYYVPSPNAERAWCYDRLADLAEFMGRGKRQDWRRKAEDIRNAIKRWLWDEERGWFRCIHPGDHTEYVYSIQMFDVLRMGEMGDNVKKGMLEQVKPGRFLGEYGVSSVSKEDETHYEVNDPDWSGSGCYSGDGPELAETLWKTGEPELAFDVLRRHFWLGTMAPFIPQEHYCDRPMMPANKRANIIAGVTGMQAVLFGMLGLEAGLDGSLTVSPRVPEGSFCQAKGYCHRGRRVDITVRPEGMEIVVDGEEVYRGSVQKTVI